VVVAHGTSENFTISFRLKGRAAAMSDFDFHEFRRCTDGADGASVDDQGTDRTNASEAAIDFEDVAVGGIGTSNRSSLSSSASFAGPYSTHGNIFKINRRSLAVSSVCTLIVDARTVSTIGASPELVEIEIYHRCGSPLGRNEIVKFSLVP